MSNYPDNNMSQYNSQQENARPDRQFSDSSSSIPPFIKLLIAMGISVFPVSGVRDDGTCTCGKSHANDPKQIGKHPLIKWKEGATTDERKVLAWSIHHKNCNWAAVTGSKSGFFVLDIDKDKGGYDSLHQLEQDLGLENLGEDTTQNITGSGGLHILFTLPADKVIRNKTDLLGKYTGLDIRGEGGYIVVPPSRHRSGGNYNSEVEHLIDEVGIQPAPDALIELLSEDSRSYENKKDSDDEKWNIVDDAELGLQLLREVCPRFQYGEAHPDKVGYDFWVAILSWLVALFGEVKALEIFDEFSRMDNEKGGRKRYNPQTVVEKWQKARGLKPYGCKRVQSDTPLPECESCPLYGKIANPSLGVRIKLNELRGLSGPWGAPERTSDETEEEVKVFTGMFGVDFLSTLSSAYKKKLKEGDAWVKSMHKFREDTFEYEGCDPFEGVYGSLALDSTVKPVMAIDNEEKKRLLEKTFLDLLEQLRSKSVTPNDAFSQGASILAKMSTLPTSVVAPPVIDQMARKLCNEAPRNTISIKSLRENIAYTVDMMREEEWKQRLADIPQTVGDAWPFTGYPEAHKHVPLPTSGDYEYRAMGIVLIKNDKNGLRIAETICTPMYIGGVVQFVSDVPKGRNTVNQSVGEEKADQGVWVQVCYLKADGIWGHFFARPADFSDKRAVARYSNIEGVIIYREGEVGEFLRQCYHLYLLEFRERTLPVTARTGWHPTVDDMPFALADECIGGEVPLWPKSSGDAEVVNNYHRNGDYRTQFNEALGIIADYPELAFAYGVSFGAALMRPLHHVGELEFHGYGVEYYNPSGNTGKTTTLKFAASVWGDPNALVQIAKSTQNGLLDQLAATTDLPTFLEETQLNDSSGGRNELDPMDLLHMLSAGTSKKRSLADGGTRKQDKFFGIAMIAANAPFLPSNKQGASGTRVYTFDRTPLQTAGVAPSDAAAKIMPRITSNYGHVGPVTVKAIYETAKAEGMHFEQFVLRDYEIQCNELDKAVGHLLEGMDKDERERFVSHAVVARLGMHYILKYGEGDVTEEPFLNGVDQAIVRLAEYRDAHAEERDKALSTLNKVADWVYSNLNRVKMGAMYTDPIIGRVSSIGGENHICIQPRDLERFLKIDCGVDISVVRDAWIDRKYLATESGTRKLYRPKGDAGLKKAMYCFPERLLGIDTNQYKRERQLY